MVWVKSSIANIPPGVSTLKKVSPQENPLYDGQPIDPLSSPPADAAMRPGIVAKTPSRRAVDTARPAASGSPGKHAQATASSRARQARKMHVPQQQHHASQQINREELSRRIAARQARAASTRKPREDDADDDAVVLDDPEDVVESPLPPDALPGVGLGGRHWHPGHLQAQEAPPREAETPGEPRPVPSWRTKRLDCYKRGPAVPLCGDLFLVGQPAEGPPACPRMPAWWCDRAFQTTDFLLLVCDGAAWWLYMLYTWLHRCNGRKASPPWRAIPRKCRSAWWSTTCSTRFRGSTGTMCTPCSTTTAAASASTWTVHSTHPSWCEA